MASDRATQIHKLIWAYAEGRDEQSKMRLESAITSIPEKEVVEVLSYGYYDSIFSQIWHYIKIFFAKLFRRYNSDQCRTVFHHAVQYGHLEVIELILETVKPDEAYSLLKKQTHSSQRTAVYDAAEKDYTKTLQLMRTAVQSDKKWRDIISIQDPNGRTSVHAAAVKSKANSIGDMLLGLEHKCEVLKIPDNEGNTALHLAAKDADSNTRCQLTLDLNENEMYDLLKIQNKGVLETTIHLIAEYGTAAEFSNLIRQVGDAQVEEVLKIPNKEGKTAEDIAKDRNDRTLLDVIQHLSRDANMRNANRRNANWRNGSRSVAQPQISSRDNSERYPVPSDIVENKDEITGINHQSNHSGNTQLEDITEPGGNSHPEEETRAEEETQRKAHIHQEDSIV